MFPAAVGLDSNAVISGFIDRAAGLKGESSHGVTVLGGLEGVNPSEGAAAPWERIYQAGTASASANAAYSVKKGPSGSPSGRQPGKHACQYQPGAKSPPISVAPQVNQISHEP